MTVHYSDETVTVHHGDCLSVLPNLADNSIDAVVTDPPYGLDFMGKHWDTGAVAFNPEVWQHCRRVLKPGGHLVAFGGTRTWHRLAVAVEDAGFEIRDSVAWLRAGAKEQVDILGEWRRWSANSAAVRFADAGESSALAPVLLSTNLESEIVSAPLAELDSSAAHPMLAERWRSAQSGVGANTMAFSDLATSVGDQPANLDVRPTTTRSTAQRDALGWLGENMAAKLKAVEALRIWLGSNKSSRRAATDALCAALTDDLRLITLSRSGTFLSYDTTRQMVCVSATTVITTESTAAHLISSMVAILASRGGDATESHPGPLAWVYGSGFP